MWLLTVCPVSIGVPFQMLALCCKRTYCSVGLINGWWIYTPCVVITFVDVLVLCDRSVMHDGYLVNFVKLFSLCELLFLAVAHKGYIVMVMNLKKKGLSIGKYHLLMRSLLQVSQ